MKCGNCHSRNVCLVAVKEGTARDAELGKPFYRCLSCGHELDREVKPLNALILPIPGDRRRE